MHELYELKKLLIHELEEYGKKGEMSAGALDVVDKLAHATKNLCKVIEAMEDEEGYSERGRSYGYRNSRDGGGSNRGSYDDGSYARGRGRYAKRDSMGRYSRDGGYSATDDMEGMVDSIRSMMHDLPESVQKDAQRFVQKLEEQM